MLKERLLPISIFCLSISIIISASIIAKGMRQNGEYVNNGLYGISNGLNNISNKVNNNNNSNSTPTNNNGYSNNIYNLSDVASYIGISEIRLKEIIDLKESGIPYIKTGTSYTFNKNALDKWLETAIVEID
ncbi:hypothetical protein [Clostridium sp.]|uniref:hypothetical protein n=1 Tax=Clostridium sp. TaxID=1506 RepID=UPI002618E164|nr:hypothetical protein [Clostridium sp.]